METSNDDLDLMFQEAKTFMKTSKAEPDKEKNVCRSCKKFSLLNDFTHGIIVCTACGVINDNQIIDESAEWSFGADEAAGGGKDPARCGMPTNPFFEKSGCSTVIGGPAHKNFFMKKLHAQMSMDYVERSRYHMFNKIGRMCDSLSASVFETVKSYYVEMAREKLSRGNVRLGLIACCIFYACKKHKVTRSIKEVSSMCEIEPSIFNSAHKIFREIMKEHIPSELFEETTQVDDLITRFCGYLNFDRKQRCYFNKRITQMNETIDQTQILIGKTPSAITASCIYYICQKDNIDMSKKHISKQVNVSIVTINKIYQIIENQSHLFYQ